MDSVQTTSAFDHEDNLDGQNNKQGNTRTTGLPSMEYILVRMYLRWTGHIVRMSPDRLPKQVLYSQLSSGQMESKSQVMDAVFVASRPTA